MNQHKVLLLSRYNIPRHTLRQILSQRCFCSVLAFKTQSRYAWYYTSRLNLSEQMASYKENQECYVHTLFFVIKDTGLKTRPNIQYIMTHNLSFYYIRIFFVYLQLSHLWLVWYWRPTKNNYPWCWRQAELNWKPWQHSACLSNPLALPESRQIPAQALAYSTPAQKKTFPNCRYENTPGRNSFDRLLFFYSISISHTTTDKQAWLLFPYTVSLILLVKHLQCGDSICLIPNKRNKKAFMLVTPAVIS